MLFERVCEVFERNRKSTGFDDERFNLLAQQSSTLSSSRAGQFGYDSADAWLSVEQAVSDELRNNLVRGVRINGEIT